MESEVSVLGLEKDASVGKDESEEVAREREKLLEKLRLISSQLREALRAYEAERDALLSDQANDNWLYLNNSDESGEKSDLGASR